MSIHSVEQHHFDFFTHKSIVVEAGSQLCSSDAGLLPLRQFDDKIGLSQQLADALHDPRDQQDIQHPFSQMLRSRLFGILAGYADQNDHTTLRDDPVFALLADHNPSQGPTASQPTLSRFENSIDIPSLRRLRDVFIDQYIASFERAPREVVIDRDAVDDPAHGSQQLVLFHGYYGQYQYLPLIVTCGQTGQVLMAGLRMGSCHAALGADDDLRYLVGRLRQAWPDVHIAVRADAGYGVPSVYQACEELQIDYTLGLSANPVLNRRSQVLLERAQTEFDSSGEAQRLFDGFWYQAGSWTHPRWVVVKAEVNAQGTNRRYVVSNRRGALVCPGASYDAYAERGESENRNKELKCDLQMDRLSDSRFLANYFRLYLHCASLNLLIRLRRELSESIPLPTSATPEQRKREENRRRREAPLGEGQPGTWRRLLIKVAAVIKVSCRRVLVELSGNWPYLEWYERVSQHVTERPAVAHFWPG